jgi:tetratricopeptide (TPR) repeat protein
MNVAFEVPPAPGTARLGPEVPARPASAFSPDRLALLLLGLTLVATAAVYLPACRYDFVSFDDPEYVTGNRFVQGGLTWANVRWAFTTTWSSYWHPVTWLSHMLDVTLFGTGSFGPHAVNVALHLASTTLLFVWLRRATRQPLTAVVVAALFALHPLHVESVAWISERKDLLSAFFFLATLHAWTRFAKANSGPSRRGWYAASVALFALAALCKPMVVTLPCVLLLLDVWPLRRFAGVRVNPALRRSRLLEKWPFFLVASGLAIVTWQAQVANGALHGLNDFGPGQRAINALVAGAWYVRNLVWPGQLAFFYPHPDRWPAAQLSLAVAVLALVGAVLWRARREDRAIVVGALWFAGMLVPVLGLVQVGDQAYADRYTYLPSIGFFLSGVALVRYAWRRLQASFGPARRRPQAWRAPATGATVLLLAAYASAAALQLPVWRDSESLFQRALAVTEGNFIAHNNLGALRLAEGNVAAAIAEFEESARLQPRYAPPHSNLGLAQLRAGDAEAAIGSFRHAVALQPRFAEVHLNLAEALRASGRWTEALASYDAALSLRPDLALAHAGTGRTLLALGRSPEAVTSFRQAATFSRHDAALLASLGDECAAAGDGPAALDLWDLAVVANPRDGAVRGRRGQMLLELGRTTEAITALESAVDLVPRDAELRNALGWALLLGRRAADAAVQFERSLALAPDQPRARANLALALAASGQTARAIAAYRELAAKSPQNARVLSDLAWLLATSANPALRDGPGALELATRATALTGGRDARILRTKAAALAESGRFSEACDIVSTALRLSEAAGDTAIAAELTGDLDRYRNAMPLRVAAETAPRPRVSAAFQTLRTP